MCVMREEKADGPGNMACSPSSPTLKISYNLLEFRVQEYLPYKSNIWFSLLSSFIKI